MSDNALRAALDELIRARNAILASPEGHQRLVATFSLVNAAARFAGHVCGKRIMDDAYGSASADDPAELLKLVSQRVTLASGIFYEQEANVHLEPSPGSLISVSTEAIAVSQGDDPQLFARLPQRVRPARVVWLKFAALRWEAYLDAAGVGINERRSAIVSAFGLAEWGSTKGWASEIGRLFGDEVLKRKLEAARQAARSNAIPPWALPPSASSFQDTIARDGAAYRRAASIHKAVRSRA